MPQSPTHSQRSAGTQTHPQSSGRAAAVSSGYTGIQNQSSCPSAARSCSCWLTDSCHSRNRASAPCRAGEGRLQFCGWKSAGPETGGLGLVTGQAHLRVAGLRTISSAMVYCTSASSTLISRCSNASSFYCMRMTDTAVHRGDRFLELVGLASWLVNRGG